MAKIGLLILMGVAVNNGVVFVDRYNQHINAGMTPADAAIHAGCDRLRPILMTLTTTSVGLLPLALGNAQIGSLYYYPLARTVIGGLVTSSMFVLLVVPVLVIAVERWRDSMLGFWRRTAP